MKYVTTSQGVRLAVRDEGRGSVILFVHGFPLDHSMWDAQVEALAPRWRVIAPDLRGLGQSQVVPGTSTMQQMADDLAEVLGALAVAEPAVVCGLSMGGCVAWQLWLRHRNRVRALIVCDARAAADSPQGVEARMKVIDQVLASGPASVVESMIGRLFAVASLDRIASHVQQVREVILSSSSEGIVAAQRGLAARPDLTANLKEIDVPTLIVVGKEDVISPVEEMQAIAATMPGARFVVVPGAGHMTPVEQPAAFNAALAAFLTELP